MLAIATEFESVVKNGKVGRLLFALESSIDHRESCGTIRRSTTVRATVALRCAKVFETVLPTPIRTYIKDRRIRSIQALRVVNRLQVFRPSEISAPQQARRGEAWAASRQGARHGNHGSQVAALEPVPDPVDRQFFLKRDIGN